MLLCSAVVAQPPQQTTDDNPDRRLIEDLIIQIRELHTKEPLRAAELFDSAWEAAVLREDPLVHRNSNSEDQLKPGEHRVDAGSRAELLRVYRDSSAEFRTAYREFVRTRSETDIAAAEQAGIRDLVRAVQRYQFTPAGQQALQQIIQIRLSRGEYLHAALQFGHLRNLQNDESPENTLRLAMMWWNAGLPEEAISYVSEVVKSHAGQDFVVNGRSITLPQSTDDVLNWFLTFAANDPLLADAPNSGSWIQPKGNYRRNRNQQIGPAALQERWKVSSFECAWNPALDVLLKPLAELIRRRTAFELKRNATIAPAAAPLLVDNLLIFRGIANVRAVDRNTGQLVWESSYIDPQLRGALEVVNRDAEDRYSSLADVLVVLQDSLFGHLVRANSSGQLTCAGPLVFSVEEVSAETMSTSWDRQTPASGVPVNYLRAHNLKTGQFVGMLGGHVGLSPEDVAANPLKGYFVLGAPLVIGDRIYLMAENDQGIFLLQLSFRQLDQRYPPYSLRPVHSQLLSHPRHKLRQHPVRMYSGVTPSFGRGLLICNTCDEQIVAVSAEDHSVRWVHRYATSVAAPELNSQIGGVLGNAFGRDASNDVDLARRWQDALPRILTDRVLVTPRDSARLLCLDLQTGRQLWTRPRGNMRRIVHADESRVVLTGTDSVQCLSTADGSPVWESRFDQGFICGKAASDGRILHVPVSAPAIVTLDLATGRQLISQSVSGGLPGNLLSIDGLLYSQSLTEVRCFGGSENERPPRLEIATRQLMDGKQKEAEQTLREIITSKDEAERGDRRQAQSILAESLLESLRMDFRANAARLPELRRLIDESSPQEDSILALTESFLGMTPRDIAMFPELWQRVDEPHRQRERLQMLSARHQLRGFNGTGEELAEHVMGMLDESFPIRQSFGQVGPLSLRISHAVAGAVRKAVSELDAAAAVEVRRIVGPQLSQRISRAGSAKEAQWWIRMCLHAGFPEPAVDLCLQKNGGTEITSELTRLLVACRLQTGSHLADESHAAKLLTAWTNSGTEEFAAELAARTSLFRAKDRQRVENVAIDESVAANLIAPATIRMDAIAADNIGPAAELPFARVPTVKVSPDRSVSPSAAGGANAIRICIPLFGNTGAFPRWSFVQRLGADAIEAIDRNGQTRWTWQPRHPLLGTTGRYGWRYNRVSQHYAVAWDRFLAIKLHQLIFVLDCATADRDNPPKLLWELNLSDRFPAPSRAQQVIQAWQRTTQYDMQPSGLFPLGPLTPHGVAIYSGQRMIMFDTLSGDRNWQLDGLPDDCTITTTDDELLLISESSGSVQTRSMIDGSVTKNTPLPDWWTDAAENSNSSIRDFDPEAGEGDRWRLNINNGNCLLLRRNKTASMLEQFSLAENAVTWSVELPADTVVSNIVDGNIALLTDGRRLQILNMHSGINVADVDVPPAPKCRFLYLRPSGDRWIVLTDVFDPDPDDENPVGAISVHVNGPVYAVNEGSGKLDWSVDVSHRWIRILNPDQAAFPPVMPLLVLLKKPYRRDEAGRIRGARVQAHVYDTRTGQLLFDDEDLGYGLSYHRLNPDSNRNQVEISFDSRSVLFDYNAQPDQAADKNDE